MNKEQQKQFFKDFRERQLEGSENLTQTSAIIKSREEKLKDLENIEKATDKFFNNKKDDTTISDQ